MKFHGESEKIFFLFKFDTFYKFSEIESILYKTIVFHVKFNEILKIIMEKLKKKS